MNVLAGSLLKSSVFHSGVAGGLAIIEGNFCGIWTPLGKGVRGGNSLYYVRLEVEC